MGKAYGTLMKQELHDMQKEFFEWAENYLTTNLSEYINRLPKFIKKWLGKTAIKTILGVLDLNYLITKAYTPKRWDEEYRGIGDGSGIKASIWREINLIPELLKAACSISGAWGPATKSGKLIQVRALDWEAHAPMSKWPQITVYHSTEPGSVPFANIAWTGFIGSLTGYSSTGIGISERLRGGPGELQTRFGKPWTYVLRDVMQFSRTIDDALEQIRTANRTCSIYVGLGSAVNNTYRIIHYSHKEFDVFDDTNWHHDEMHPQRKGLIYKEYCQAECWKNILEPRYGSLDAEVFYKYVTPSGQTGDSQVIVTDYATHTIYAAYPDPKTSVPGYFRPFVEIDLKPFFFEMKW